MSERNWIQDYLNLCGDTAGQVLFDVGASRGCVLDQLLRLVPNTRVYAFEPIPELALQLKATHASSAEVQVLPIALGSTDRKRLYNVNRFNETSSFLPVAAEVEHRPVMQRVREIEVDERRIDSLCRELGLQTIHLVKLDVQGYELEVLKGAGDRLRDTRAVFAEVTFVPRYRGQAQYAELDAFLNRAGFSLFNLYNMSSSTATGQLGACDIMWVNRHLIPHRFMPEEWEVEWNARNVPAAQGSLPKPACDVGESGHRPGWLRTLTLAVVRRLRWRLERVERRLEMKGAR